MLILDKGVASTQLQTNQIKKKKKQELQIFFEHETTFCFAADKKVQKSASTLFPTTKNPLASLKIDLSKFSHEILNNTSISLLNKLSK